jgi:hypothetical protein
MVMRPVMIVDKPPVHPHVCVQCGKQDDRDYFVDLGFDISVLYQPLWEGCIYLCNLCMENIVNSYQAALTKFYGTDNLQGQTYKYADGVDPLQGELDLNGTDGSDEPGTTPTDVEPVSATDEIDYVVSTNSESTESSNNAVIDASTVILGNVGLTFSNNS